MAAAAPTRLNLKFLSPALGGTHVTICSEPIENGADICLISSPQPDPNLTIESNGPIAFEIAVWHGTKDTSSHPMDGRTGYGPLLEMLISEVKFVIDTVRIAALR